MLNLALARSNLLAVRSIQTMSVPSPLVLCGPSGSGKSTLLKKLMEEFPESFGFSISHTTRKPRPGENHGKDYYFVDRPDMEKAIGAGEFIESAEFSGNLYGTSKKAVEDVQNTGKICVLDIDVQGVKNIKKTNLSPKYVFIKPPSMEKLEQRLRDRKTETQESLQRRLTTAKKELEYAEMQGNFDVTIVNDEVDVAYLQLRRALLPQISLLTKK